MSAPIEVVGWRTRRRVRLRQRFLRRPPAVAGLAFAITAILIALLAPLVAPYSPDAQNFGAALAQPGGPHLLGTDELGRDVLSRVIWGARASIQAGVVATLLAMAVAVPLGLIAGYFRGGWDPVIMRFTDLLLSFPFLVLAVGLAAILGPSLTNATLALGIAAVPAFVRVTRGEVLGLREEDYVVAAVADGATDRVVITRHILPNTVSPLLVQATVTIPTAIIGESLLSFLGLGVQPPTPSWGVMLSSAQSFITQAPWLALFPGIAIFLTTLSFNLLGDGLRDVLDPKALT
ncbi:ABC transporter permease [Qaidamihabitans albus]|uniref:ABC transporter permease n=1 Tax=Qaidamihabitans albus TaxID=2795733 RepID=UPI0018F11080|nr:ABC transporter permease [Qaidamihabitans albus]